MLVTLSEGTVDQADEYLRITRLVVSPINRVAVTINEALDDMMSHSTTYFISVDGQIVGLIAYRVKSEYHVYISEFAIDPIFQGRGIGGKALDLLLNKFREEIYVDLATHPENPARALYERHGFRLKELVSDWNGYGPRAHYELRKG